MKQKLLTFLLILSFQLTLSQSYTEVAQTLGITHYFGLGDFGGGVSFFDFNGDGWDDLTLATTGGDSVYFYENTGGSFQKITPCPIDFTGEAKQVIWADIDNDGDPDLFVGGHLSGNHLYENTGNLNLVDITAASGISTDTMPTFGASWADYDKDGFLDLYIINRTLGGTILPNRNYFYRNLGNKTFQDVTMAIGVADSNQAPFCASFFDYNNDGWEDIYIAQDKYLIPNTLLKHNGNGGYTDVSAGSGADRGMDAMCVAIGDYNNDDYQDIYVTNTAGGNSLFLNNGNETFTDTANGSGVGFFGPSWGANFFDYDNDLDLDLYVSGENISSQPGLSRLYANDGNGQFAVPSGIGFTGDTLRSFSNALGDINNDGYMDIAVTNFDQHASTLWMNSGGNNNWLKLDLEGTTSNRDAVGTRIEYWLQGNKYMRYTHCGISFIAQNSQYECLSMGSHTYLDTLKIKWPNGLVETHHNLCANQTIHLTEGAGPVEPMIGSSTGLTICQPGDSILLNAGVHAFYLWSTGDTSQTISVTTADTFQLSVITTDGVCTKSEPVITLTGIPMALTTQSTGIGCAGELTGTASISLSGGQPPFTYLWSNGSTTPMLDSLSGGLYVVTITDAPGCTITDSTAIHEPLPLQLNSASTPASPSCLGAGWVIVSGGTPPYSIQWNDPLQQIGDTASGLCPGTYLVMVTDSNGCMGSMEIEVVDTSTPVGIHLPNSGVRLSLFPNPTREHVGIELQGITEGAFSLELYSATGGLVKRLEEIEVDNMGEWRGSLQLKALPAGIYFLTVFHEDLFIRKKLILLE